MPILEREEREGNGGQCKLVPMMVNRVDLQFVDVIFGEFGKFHNGADGFAVALQLFGETQLAVALRA